MAYYPQGWQPNQPYQAMNTGFTGGFPRLSNQFALQPGMYSPANQGFQGGFSGGYQGGFQGAYGNGFNARGGGFPSAFSGQPGGMRGYDTGYAFRPFQGSGRMGYQGAYGYQDSFNRQSGWMNQDYGYNDYGYNDYGYGGNTYNYFGNLLDDKALADLAYSTSTPSPSPSSAGSLADIFAALGLGATSISTPTPAPASSSDGLGSLNDLLAFLNGTSDSLTGSGSSTTLASAGGSTDDQIAALLGSLGLS